MDYEALPTSCTFQDHIIAGACAGIMEHLVMYPVDSVKTRMQCIRPHDVNSSRGVLDGLLRLIRTEGLRGSVKGSGAMIGGAGPAHAAYFACYEYVKERWEQNYKSNFSVPLGPIIGGACATMFHDVIMTPADAIKQRLQIYNSPYHNTVDCVRRVCLTEGTRVLYRAYFTQLTMNIPYQSIHFLCYESLQKSLNPSNSYLPWTHMVAGGTAGCVAAACTTPLDVCKTFLNTQDGCLPSTSTGCSSKRSRPQEIRGLLQSSRLIFRLEGFRGFFRGTSARVLTAIPGTAISWSVYEYFKWYLKTPSSNASDSGNGSPPDTLSDSQAKCLRSRLLTRSNEVVCATQPPTSQQLFDD